MMRKLEGIREKHKIDEKLAAERDNMEDDSEDDDWAARQDNNPVAWGSLPH